LIAVDLFPTACRKTDSYVDEWLQSARRASGTSFAMRPRAEELKMFNKLLGFALIASFVSLASAAERSPLAASVAACMAGDPAACSRTRERLRRDLDDADAQVSTARLVDAALKLLSGAGPLPPAVVSARSACTTGDAHACARLAAVLDQLFRGDDATLAASPDAALAHATARALVDLARERPRG
jgi:hypothetical protein